MAPSEFWQATPYATGVLLQAAGEEIEARQQEAMWAVWHGEALARTKQLPRLQDILKPAQPTRAKTPEEIDAILFQAAACRE